MDVPAYEIEPATLLDTLVVKFLFPIENTEDEKKALIIVEDDLGLTMREDEPRDDRDFIGARNAQKEFRAHGYLLRGCTRKGSVPRGCTGTPLFGSVKPVMHFVDVGGYVDSLRCHKERPMGITWERGYKSYRFSEKKGELVLNCVTAEYKFGLFDGKFNPVDHDGTGTQVSEEECYRRFQRLMVRCRASDVIIWEQNTTGPDSILIASGLVPSNNCPWMTQLTRCTQRLIGGPEWQQHMRMREFPGRLVAPHIRRWMEHSAQLLANEAYEGSRHCPPDKLQWPRLITHPSQLPPLRPDQFL